MWFNLLVAILVIVVPAIWSTKAKGYGAFSSLLAAVCALAAGGIAFAVWEPFSYMILGWGAGSSGFVSKLLQGSAFGLGLAVPYLGALVVLRLAIDSMVKANLDLGETINMIGGALFGIVTSVITVGIFVISVGFLQLPSAIMGYAPIEERNGQVVYANRLWIPADLIVTRMYERLSLGAFGSPTPLARAYPNLHEAAGMQRMTYRDASKNTVGSQDFELLGAYAIAGAADELAKDSFVIDVSGQSKKQTIVYPDGSSPTGAATLTGYLIRFTSGAKEKGGNVVVTPGQLRLVCEDESGSDLFAIHPFAVIAPPEAGSAGLYRFRFVGTGEFIASQGGGADAVFAFEFMLPQGYAAKQLFIKNHRVDLESNEKAAQPRTLPNYQSRDKIVQEGSILGLIGASAGSTTAAIQKAGSVKAAREGGRFEGIETGPELPNGYTFSRNNKGSLDLNDANDIVGGETRFKRSQLNERGIDKNLRVEKFFTGSDTGFIKVRLSAAGTRTVFGRGVEAAESTAQPALIDERGTRYEPIGYLYEEGEEAILRFSAGSPLRSISEFPALSRTKRDQSLTLIFKPTKGAKIMSFVVGSQEIASFDGGMEVR